MKRCGRCRSSKSLSEFGLNSTRADGHYAHCIACRAYHRGYMKIEKNKTRRDALRYLRDERSPRAVMQITLRHGLQRRPTEHPATIEDLMHKWRKQEGRCAVSGLMMTWNKGTVLPTSISLDRIDPTGGYSSDNLRLICHAMNAFKGRMSDAEMLTMAKALVANMKTEDRSLPSFPPDSVFMVMQ